ncbi:emerin (Emery-Dreifuss muscular dystrophy) [Erpetoichthys calabaricus]|uniref:emerin (Emery-Dreifuss muscular dystrophy) n=1 Tax=Erpetoichthys calabaricus TaxID=27687 RepID=UPI00223443C3|nr:emerin (Emery-Dreifuss muscular dystrophy) [Erpetoichthys calabaricus]
MNFSNKTDKEIAELLDQYMIKHGPVVGSTRKLYEKKLHEALESNEGKKSSPLKTIYQEEEEEIILTRSALRPSPKSELYTDWEARTTEMDHHSAYNRKQYSTEPTGHSFKYQEVLRDYKDESQPIRSSSATFRNVSHSKPSHVTAPVKPTTIKDSQDKRYIPIWLQFMVFILFAGFLYYVFTNMEVTPKNPFEHIN